ncbi:MAG: hypothetical protein E6Z60_15790, partial [Mixta calida]|nr:hypothetical protein [Mixta calida]
IEYSATNRAVGGSNPPGCTIFSTHLFFYLPDYFSLFSGLVFSVIPFIAPFISLSLSPVLIARQHSLCAANSLTFF